MLEITTFDDFMKWRSDYAHKYGDFPDRLFLSPAGFSELLADVEGHFGGNLIPVENRTPNDTLRLFGVTIRHA